MRLRIGFVYDLRREYLALGYTDNDVAEFDSEETVLEIEKILRRLGHDVVRIGHGRALCSRLAAGERWDLVFTIAEGLHGRSREAQVPALLELFDMPYTFSDPLVCAVTLDKAVAKQLVRAAGLHTPAHHVVREPADLDQVRLRYPLFAKPLAEGTGKGIDERSRVANLAELTQVCRRLLRDLRSPVLVEEYLSGREFTVGILGSGAAARAIGAMEVVIRPEVGHAIYSFDNKERCEQLVEYSRLQPGSLRDDIQRLALDAYRVLDCRDAGRVDIRLDARGVPSFLEVNPLPGLHPTHSDLPMIATQEGMSYEELLGAVIESASRRIPAPLGSKHEETTVHAVVS